MRTQAEQLFFEHGATLLGRVVYGLDRLRAEGAIVATVADVLNNDFDLGTLPGDNEQRALLYAKALDRVRTKLANAMKRLEAVESEWR